MKILTGDFIKHKSFRDVALFVLKVTESPDSVKIRAYWVNQGMNKTFLIPVPTQEMVISIEDLDLWYRCRNKKSKCVRHEQWENLSEVA